MAEPELPTIEIVNVNGIEVEVVVDESPEAKAAYLEALKILVRRIREKRELAAGKDKLPTDRPA